MEPHDLERVPFGVCEVCGFLSIPPAHFRRCESVLPHPPSKAADLDARGGEDLGERQGGRSPGAVVGSWVNTNTEGWAVGAVACDSIGWVSQKGLAKG